MSSFASCGTSFVDDDVGYLEAAAGLEHPPDPLHHHHFIRAEVDHGVADDHINGLIVYRQLLGEAPAAVDVIEAELSGAGSGLLQHGGGHVYSDDASAGADLAGGDESIEAGAAADVEDGLAGAQVAEGEGVAGTGKGVDGALGKRVYESLVVAQHAGQGASVVKVEPLIGGQSDIGVLVADLAAQHIGVDSSGANLGSDGNPPFSRNAT